MSTANPSILNYEHTDWLKAIDFYKEDLTILQKRLAEVSFKNTSKEAMAGVEHFQNQFIIQRNNLDELRHYINEHIQHFVQDITKHEDYVVPAIADEHARRKDEFESLEKVMADLRHEFNDFLAKWM
ncbi:MAG TPA: hypothetical protein PKE63_14140 [Lacibacter sp.]|nr:hypothetical protein [Lacibacter sp.]HMO88984.1 hypothetical protein [Lacibacter sp.]HMP88415.1 hypothetical protein [Lacibacter sp.]